MARKNPRRRLIAKIKACDQHARELTRAYNDEPINGSAPIRSSVRLVEKHSVLSHPRERWENPGKAPRKPVKLFDGRVNPHFNRLTGKDEPQKG